MRFLKAARADAVCPLRPRDVPIFAQSSLRAALRYIEASVSTEQLQSLQQRLALWRKRIELTVTTLHEHGITLTTPVYGSTIYELNLEVDSQDEVWLPLSYGTVSIGKGGGEPDFSIGEDSRLDGGVSSSKVRSITIGGAFGRIGVNRLRGVGSRRGV